MRIRSTLIKISDQEYVEIGNTKYSGKLEIDAIVSSNFTVAFQSYENAKKQRSVLTWSCLKLGDWSPTGTCSEVKSLQPEYIGEDSAYRPKYRKTNDTCSKFINLK